MAADYIDVTRQLVMETEPLSASKSQHALFTSLGVLDCSHIMIPIIQRTFLSRSLVYIMQSWFHNHLQMSSNLVYRDWLRRIKVKHSQSCDGEFLSLLRSASHRVSLAL